MARGRHTATAPHREEIAMAGPLEGVKVVELAVWVAGPAASGIFADWGADVVKIEAPPAGDPYRAFYSAAAGMALPINPMFELDNRGKRSVALDLRRPEGREIALRAIAAADVFVTNVRPGALERAALDPGALLARFPRLVYALATGYGTEGAERDRAAYDAGAFWGRAGIGATLAPPDGEPPFPRTAFGDHATALALAAGVGAALFARERRGRGGLVTTSLLRTGLYIVGADTNQVLRLGIPPIPLQRAAMPNPLCTFYRARDGRWIFLLGLQADRHWPDLVRAVDRPDWLADPRFASIATRREHFQELIAELDAVFATRPFAEWAERLDAAGMWWAPVQTIDEAVRDPQAEASGAFIDVPVAEGTARMLATPVDFADHRPAAARPVPETGQHTEEVLLELGYDWEAIAGLKSSGVIP
jgi:crotonobetainyl-CoA:carnitine CoA-transferase CaiB-like acyl-CoA transferase